MSGLDTGAQGPGPGEDAGEAGEVQASKTRLSLGTVVVGSTKEATFTIINPGTQRLQVQLSMLSGANASSFARSANIPQTDSAFALKGDAQAVVTVMATPIEAEALMASLTVGVVEAGQPIEVQA